MARTGTKWVRAAVSGSEQAGRNSEDASQAGSELREARERLGWDLGDVASALRIKLAYLQAIEDGRMSALPGNAYALGFLRTYATTLGLDADLVALRFRAEAKGVNRRTELAFPAPVPERGIPTGAVVVLGLVIAAVGYVGWYRFSEHEHTATHTVPPVPEQLLAAPKAAPVSPQVASVMPPPGPTPALPTPKPAMPAPPAVTAARTPPVPPASAATGAAGSAQPPASALPPSPPPAAQPTSPPAETGLVLHATAVTWVQVRAPDGHVTWDHIMQPGDDWQVPPDQPGLTLTTGNAGGLAVSDNGTPLGALGRAGSVRHDIDLTEAGVRAAVAGSINPAAPSRPPSLPPVPHPARHLAPSSDDSADQLNARQLAHAIPR